MKTDELTAMLARGVDAIEPGVAQRRFAAATGWGTLVSALLMAVALGVRPDIAEAARLPMFWAKHAFVVVLAIAALVMAARLSRPGVRLGRTPLLLAGPVVVMWLLAAAVLLKAPVAARMELLVGHSWNLCPFYIAACAAPVLIAVLWAMRELAPTRPRLAGAAAGVLAGAIGASVYALHCTEMAAPFLGVWYVLGILLPALPGAVMGPYLLHW